VKDPESRKAVGFALLGIFVLLVSIAAGSILRGEATPMILAGFVVYVFCSRRAMQLWHADDIVFGRRRR